MKIALVTDDGKTISQHFGRATYYAVLTVENDEITGREQREKPGHHTFRREAPEGHGEGQGRGHGFGRDSEKKHRRMFDAIQDCEILVARGMGRGAYQGLEEAGIRPIVTDIEEIEEAARAILDGTIVDHSEKLH